MKSNSETIKEYCVLHGIECIDAKLVEAPLEIFKGIPFTVNHECQIPSSEPLVS